MPQPTPDVPASSEVDTRGPPPLTAAEIATQEAGWRSMALWDLPKPPPPELIPGLPGINARRLQAWHEQMVAYRLCRTERLRYGIPATMQQDPCP